MDRKKPNSKIVWRRKEASLPPSPSWTELPGDLISNILQRLDVETILEDVQRVCTTWRSVCRDPSMWRKIDMSLLFDDEFDAGIMCKHLVDRSQGQLVDVRLGFFATDALLAYIAERSGKLRFLSIDSCDDISGDGLVEAINSFPLLEELHLFQAKFLSEFVEIVGHTCPLLTSFSIGAVARDDDDNDDFGDTGTECNKVALAISKTMPGLRHLCLVGSALTNDGLVAILDGCTHLELLDLRGCLGVNLEGDIGMRCSQQVKCVKRPRESISDLEMYDSDAFEDYGSMFSGDTFMSDYEDGYFYDYEDYDDDIPFFPLLYSDDEDFLDEDYMRDMGAII